MKLTPCLFAILSLSSPFLHAMLTGRPAGETRAPGAPATRPRENRSTLSITGTSILTAFPGRGEERKAGAGAGRSTIEQRRLRHRPVRLGPGLSLQPLGAAGSQARPSNVPGIRSGSGAAPATLPALARSKDFDDAAPAPSPSSSSAGSAGSGQAGTSSSASSAGAASAEPRIELGVRSAGGLQAWVTRPIGTTRVGVDGKRVQLAQVAVVNTAAEPLCFSLPGGAGDEAPYTQVCPMEIGMDDLVLHPELEPSYQLNPGEEIQVKLDAGGESATYAITRADGTPYDVLELTFF